jgi:hypothetical protein
MCTVNFPLKFGVNPPVMRQRYTGGPGGVLHVHKRPSKMHQRYGIKILISRVTPNYNLFLSEMYPIYRNAQELNPTREIVLGLQHI